MNTLSVFAVDTGNMSYEVMDLNTGKFYPTRAGNPFNALTSVHLRVMGTAGPLEFTFGPKTLAYGDFSVLFDSVKYLWAKACEHDGIPTGSKFSIFENGNPYIEVYNHVMRAKMSARERTVDNG